MSRLPPSDLVDRGRRVLELEAGAIHALAVRLGDAFARAGVKDATPYAATA